MIAQVYLPASLAYAILFAIVVCAVIVCLMVFGVQRFLRKRGLSGGLSFIGAIAVTMLIAVVLMVGITIMNRPERSATEEDATSEIAEYEYEMERMEKAMEAERFQIESSD